MPVENLVFDPMDQFNVQSVERHLDSAVISVESLYKSGTCPACGRISRSIHSHYIRKIKDLPAFGNGISIKLKTRKFYCDEPDCNRKIFAERFNDHFSPYKRTSDRLRKRLLKIALLTGGNAGAKLCKTLSIPISSSTLIRLIHQQEMPAPAYSDALGIDDWALKKGLNYGTAIVDLKQRKIIDLLPDRESLTVENWLRKNPQVKIITRDRFARYAKGVTNGLPNAMQVADRWHLIKNLGDAVKKLLERKRQEIRRNSQAVKSPVSEPESYTVAKIFISESQARRQEHMDQIKRLHKEGIPIKQIARVTNINRNTVRKYIHLDEPPRKNIARTNIGLFNEYLQSRMDEDKNIEVMQLWKEIKAKGYNGGRSAMYEYLKGYVKPINRTRMPILTQAAWIPAKVSLLLYRNENLLSSKERELIERLKKMSPDINIASILVHKFKKMLDNKQGYLLRRWVREVERSPIRELKGFAKGLLNDYSAVKNALTLSWSNGQVEGQINKLKTVKRQMYGRASLNLLRKILVLRAEIST